MIDENCLYCNREGECTKGLPGTPCKTEGCVAHTPVGYLSWGDMTDKEKSDFLWAISHQKACSENMAKRDCHTENIETISIVPYTFSMGDRIRLKGNMHDTIGHCIADIREGYYWCDADITIPHSCQDRYEKF